MAVQQARQNGAEGSADGRSTMPHDRRAGDGWRQNESTDGREERIANATINRPAEELYRFYRDFRNLPRFKSALDSVEGTGDDRYHWRVKGPVGTTFEWDVKIIDDRPNELIAWRSVEGSDVDVGGTVRFQPAPGGRGTVVRDEIHFRPPVGGVAAKIIRFFSGVLEQQVLEDLRRFKQLMETGEIVLSEAKIGGERPAQPPPDELLRRVAAPGGAAASVSP